MAIEQLPIWFFYVWPLLLIWSLVWKGLGLWRAATKKSKVWFILILILNTAGILPIIYLIITKQKKKTLKKKKRK